jgi:hypothetical protein
MRTTVRFDIVIDADWNQSITLTVHTVAPDAAAPGPEWPPVQRSLRRHVVEIEGVSHSYPGPPADELAAITGPHKEWCEGRNLEALAATESALATRLPNDRGELFGRYLYSVLIGDVVWQRMLDAAEAVQAELIELAIRCDEADPRLHQLNWELLHGPDGFLAVGTGWRGGGRRLAVALTRRVGGLAGSPRPITFPPRLLFVVGTALTEIEIKPGAEVMGLLEQLEREDTRVQSRVLQRATPREIRHAIASFHPDVVHFICHGDIDSRTGRGFLELEQDQPGANKRYSAADLLDLLEPPRIRGGEPRNLPPIVVLSACYTAGGRPAAIMGAPAAMPLAVELVCGGLPIVIAMAGRVSDVGCRLFTRRFGETLLKEGDALIAASAEARRASFQGIGGGKASASLDWAFPVLFLSAQIDGDYIAATSAARAHGDCIRRRIKVYEVRRDPIFCARYEFADAYDELFRTDDRPVLAASVESAYPGLGRTRLLQELAARAIRDGHVPCLIASAKPTWEPPKNLAQFGAHLLGAINTARIAFKLDYATEANSQLLKMFLQHPAALPDLEQYRATPARLSVKIFELFHRWKDDLFSVGDLKWALQTDLEMLLKQVRGADPKAGTVDSRALVLIDQVERYDTALSPLLHDMLGEFGLGTADEIIRVVLVASLKTAAHQILWPWLEQGKPWLIQRQLSAFKEDGEDLLAYQRILLHPPVNPAGGERIIPMAFDDDADEELKTNFLKLFRKELRGIPVHWKNLFAIGAYARAGRFLKDADDETCLQQARAAAQLAEK